MIGDAALPPGAAAPAAGVTERHGVAYSSARWTPEALEELGAHLAGGGPALADLDTDDLWAAWSSTVEAFRDPGSAERRGLDPALARLCGLSAPGLAAGLEAVLGGVGGAPARAVFERARGAPRAGPIVVVLAANLPALAVQPLLPALALRRAVVLKSPSAEPLFAPAFVRALAAREPRLAPAMAAITWPGGDAALEAPLLTAADHVVAYGDEPTLDDLARRAPGRLVAYGPRTSLAAVDANAVTPDTAAGLARDIALFDQRGCLSIQAVYTDGDAPRLAALLAAALEERAARWPPGPPDPVAAAGVHQLRAEAVMRGLERGELALGAGTVIVEPEAAFQASPGLRTVRVHPLDDLTRLPAVLAPWAGRLQGAALAGDRALALATALGDLGVSRCAAPGSLQTPDALWHNGGAHPLDHLAG